jgi:acetyltransferase-like isoleucine patch superfamily enzyme
MERDPLESRISQFGGNEDSFSLYRSLRRLILALMGEKSVKHKRFLSIPDYFIDRWERARLMGFGEGTSVYDSCLVLGEVSVGKNTWVGPYTILDGSGGGLSIGDECAVSAGVQIYTHDTVDHVIHGDPVAIARVTIGSHVYIGPQTVVAKGVTIGDYVVIGANSLVNRDIPSGSKVFGSPARIVGTVEEEMRQQ